MSLILCRMEPVRNPFEVPELGVHLHSSQELCYVIYNNPLLVMDDFVDNRLIQFIRNDLNMEPLAEKLDTWKRSGESPDNMLLLILTHCQYYTSAEVSQYRQTLIQYRKKHPGEYGKERADYLFGKKQYGRAIPLYEKLLEMDSDSVINDRFFGRVCCCLGACQARLFRFEKAYQAYDRAYSYDSQNEGILEKIYYLKSFEPNLPVAQRYQSAFGSEKQNIWEQRIVEAKARGQESEAVKELDELFMKDEDKRLSGAVALVKKWKKEYRGML
ncbi:MAG: hypothetical protein HFG49_10530 [Lachnospiraceae bacterium]|jgi:tetratricopeptide (TPR) repeat protein|nr:hypothetical protein [Lachnospiraceae bacterium]